MNHGHWCRLGNILETCCEQTNCRNFHIRNSHCQHAALLFRQSHVINILSDCFASCISLYWCVIGVGQLQQLWELWLYNSKRRVEKLRHWQALGLLDLRYKVQVDMCMLSCLIDCGTSRSVKPLSRHAGPIMCIDCWSWSHSALCIQPARCCLYSGSSALARVEKPLSCACCRLSGMQCYGDYLLQCFEGAWWAIGEASLGTTVFRDKFFRILRACLPNSAAHCGKFLTYSN